MSAAEEEGEEEEEAEEEEEEKKETKEEEGEGVEPWKPYAPLEVGRNTMAEVLGVRIPSTIAKDSLRRNAHSPTPKTTWWGQWRRRQ